jgi:hypothetical protein
MHHRTVRGLISLLLGGLLLAAGTPARADTTPASFDFVNVTVSDKEVVESNVVTVRGIDEPTPILISGHSSGRFRINGDEPAPNGGRRNLGSYGGTVEATPSP